MENVLSPEGGSIKRFFNSLVIAFGMVLASTAYAAAPNAVTGANVDTLIEKSAVPPVSGLTAGSYEITASWTAAVANGTPVTDYIITAARISGTGPNSVGPFNTGGATSYTISGLDYDTEYRIEIIALSGVDPSATAFANVAAGIGVGTPGTTVLTPPPPPPPLTGFRH